MDASGCVASLLLLTVVGRGRHTMLSDRGTVLYFIFLEGCLGQRLFWGDSRQTTPTVFFFSSLDCLGGNLESSAFTSPLLKLKMLTMDTYMMSPEIAPPPLTTEVN